MRRVSLLALLLLAGPLAAADLKIVGPDRVELYRLARFTLEGLPPDASVVWEVEPEIKEDDAPDGYDSPGFRFVGPPAAYKLRATVYTIENGKLKVRVVRRGTTIGTPEPGPPVPVPTPTPDPKPPAPAPTPNVDADLAAKFRTALAIDGPADKVHAAKLAGVYLETAKRLLTETTSPTVADLYSRTFEASVLAGVPRRDKALDKVRGVIDGLGTFPTTAVLTGPAKDTYVALWTRIGASLAEAAK